MKYSEQAAILARSHACTTLLRGGVAARAPAANASTYAAARVRLSTLACVPTQRPQIQGRFLGEGEGAVVGRCSPSGRERGGCCGRRSNFACLVPTDAGRHAAVHHVFPTRSNDSCCCPSSFPNTRKWLMLLSIKSS
eukprot:353886-Chlamydomonas_euryale.AAC.5